MGIGRLLYTKSALPAVRLLPFSLRDNAMLLALDQAAEEQLVHVVGGVAAVQVDDLARGWTITITSEVHYVDSPMDLRFLERTGMSWWLDGAPQSYVRVEPMLVSGYQFIPAEGGMYLRG